MKYGYFNKGNESYAERMFCTCCIKLFCIIVFNVYCKERKSFQNAKKQNFLLQKQKFWVISIIYDGIIRFIYAIIKIIKIGSKICFANVIAKIILPLNPSIYFWSLIIWLSFYFIKVYSADYFIVFIYFEVLIFWSTFDVLLYYQKIRFIITISEGPLFIYATRLSSYAGSYAH